MHNLRNDSDGGKGKLCNHQFSEFEFLIKFNRKITNTISVLIT